MNTQILVVDDDSTSALMLRILLHSEGYHVTTASNGKQAWDCIVQAHARNAPFDLLITDIEMPILDGVELIQRTIHSAMRLPVIVTTANDDAALLRQLRRPEIATYFIKPLDLKQILAAITKILKGA